MKLAGSQLVPSKEPRMLTPEEIVVLQQDLREALSMHTPEELVAYVESKFDCKQGPFMAYVEIKETLQGERYVDRCPYVVLSYIIMPKNDETLEDRTPELVIALQKDFDTILAGIETTTPRLWWRFEPPHIFLEENPAGSDPITHERWHRGFKIRTRVAIPGWYPEEVKVLSYKPEHTVIQVLS